MQEALTSCQVTAANYRAVALENQHNSKEIKVTEMHLVLKSAVVVFLDVNCIDGMEIYQ